jgi:hypothetical protein
MTTRVSLRNDWVPENATKSANVMDASVDLNAVDRYALNRAVMLCVFVFPHLFFGKFFCRYDLAHYQFGQKEAIQEKDKTVQDRFQRMREEYPQIGAFWQFL